MDHPQYRTTELLPYILPILIIKSHNVPSKRPQMAIFPTLHCLNHNRRTLQPFVHTDPLDIAPFMQNRRQLSLRLHRPNPPLHARNPRPTRSLAHSKSHLRPSSRTRPRVGHFEPIGRPLCRQNVKSKETAATGLVWRAGLYGGHCCD